MWFALSTVGIEAIKELERGTDRTVGVLAGVLVESYLTEALKKELRGDGSPNALEEQLNLFNPDGALGFFATKIRLAYLMGFLTAQAHKDLQNLKWIRNRFAHYTESNSFATQNIKDRCANFKLINERIGGAPAPIVGEDGKVRSTLSGLFVQDGKIFLEVSERDKVLATSKGRFILTTHLFCAACEFYERAIGAQKPII